MRILMLSWEYPPRIVGGISRVVHDLAQKMGDHGNEVHVVTCRENNTNLYEKENNVIVHRVDTYDIKANNFIEWVMQLNFAFLEYCIKLFNNGDKADIIHAHDWIVAFCARALKHSYAIPLVSSIHATESGRNHGIHNDTQRYISSVEWWLTYESWRVIVNSNFMKNEVMGLFQLPADKLRIIPNGVDMDKFSGIERDYGFRRNYAMDSEKIVLFVGRLVNEKGAHILVDAASKILKHFIDIKFIITGKGPQFDFLCEKTRNLNICQKIYFTGYIDDDELLKLYKCADIAVVPSLYEPFGIVALEGMVADMPVIVSDTGGLGEIVNHGIDGLKFYTGNSNSLADCIMGLLLNPVKADKIKANALVKVGKLYSWDIIARQTVDVYKEIL